MKTDWLSVEVGVLKVVYYKLMGERQFGPAQAILQTLFEITEDSDLGWDLFCLAPGGGERPFMASGKGEVDLDKIKACLDNDPDFNHQLSAIALQDVVQRGSRLIEEGRPAEALASLNKCVSQFEDVHSCAAWALHEMGRLAECAARLLMAIEINPANVQNLNLMGQVMGDLGMPAEAEAYLRRAVKIDPGYALGYYDLDVILAKLRTRDRAARRCFSKAIQLDPNLGWAYYSIACLDALAGRRKKALENLRIALEKGVKDRKHIERDTDLDSVRSDEAFKQLITEYFSDDQRPGKSK